MWVWHCFGPRLCPRPLRVAVASPNALSIAQSRLRQSVTQYGKCLEVLPSLEAARQVYLGTSMTSVLVADIMTLPSDVVLALDPPGREAGGLGLMKGAWWLNLN